MRDRLHRTCRLNTLRPRLAEPLGEGALRQIARQIDGTWFPPEPTAEVEPTPAEPVTSGGRACLRCGVRRRWHDREGCRSWK